MKAIRKYYSRRLCSSVPPAIDDFSDDRAEKVVDLLSDIWPDQHGAECLDCGCGSGMGSLALRRSIYRPDKLRQRSFIAISWTIKRKAPS